MRGWNAPTIGVTAFSLVGGRSRYAQGEPDVVELSVEGVVAYARAWGFAGDGLVEIVEDILLIESIFLRLARERARDRIRNLNR